MEKVLEIFFITIPDRGGERIDCCSCKERGSETKGGGPTSDPLYRHSYKGGCNVFTDVEDTFSDRGGEWPST